MNAADIIILSLIAAAFVAICLRARRKGTCADCKGHCSPAQKRRCPAVQGVDAVAERLGRGVDGVK